MAPCLERAFAIGSFAFFQLERRKSLAYRQIFVLTPAQPASQGRQGTFGQPVSTFKRSRCLGTIQPPTHRSTDMDPLESNRQLALLEERVVTKRLLHVCPVNDP